MTSLAATFSAHQQQRSDFIAPQYALARGSVLVNLDGSNGYQQIQQVIGVWKENGIHDYMFYSKTRNAQHLIFEAVPFPNKGYGKWQQVQVLFRTIFGGFWVSPAERGKIVANLRETQIATAEKVNEVVKGRDPFCNQAVLDKQLVFAGKNVNVLYDYAPLGWQQHHFLITPNTHREKLRDLTEEEFVESTALTQKINDYLGKKGSSITFAFDKSGKRAGQTVPHWHRHIIGAGSMWHVLYGALQVLKNMFIGSFPLSKQTLQNRVTYFKNELATALK